MTAVHELILLNWNRFERSKPVNLRCVFVDTKEKKLSTHNKIEFFNMTLTERTATNTLKSNSVWYVFCLGVWVHKEQKSDVTFLVVPLLCRHSPHHYSYMTILLQLWLLALTRSYIDCIFELNYKPESDRLAYQNIFICASLYWMCSERYRQHFHWVRHNIIALNRFQNDYCLNRFKS